MKSFFNIFNNRELAIAIWLFIGFLWVNSKQKFRAPFVNLLKAFFVKQIIITFLLMIAYISAIILGLHKLNYWNISTRILQMERKYLKKYVAKSPIFTYIIVNKWLIKGEPNG